MADYRVYIIGHDGHFVRGILLDCPNDEAAVGLSTAMTLSFGSEIAG